MANLSNWPFGWVRAAEGSQAMAGSKAFFNLQAMGSHGRHVSGGVAEIYLQ